MRYPWISRISLVVLVGVIVLAWHTPARSDRKDNRNHNDQKSGAVPVIVDATNKVVGQVVGISSLEGLSPRPLNPVVVLEIPGHSVIATVTPDYILGNVYLYFTSANCTGQPYINATGAVAFNQPHMFPLVGVANGILYGLRANSTPVTISTASLLSVSSSTCVFTGGGAVTGIIADPIIDLSTQFTPPYRFVYP